MVVLAHFNISKRSYNKYFNLSAQNRAVGWHGPCLKWFDTDTIYYGFGFAGKKLNEIKLADIKEMDVVQYVGYSTGMRVSDKYGMVYNMDRGMGLFVTDSKGPKVFIGTKQPDELKAAIAKMNKRA
jgi:hypothetical protein